MDKAPLESSDLLLSVLPLSDHAEDTFTKGDDDVKVDELLQPEAPLEAHEGVTTALFPRSDKVDDTSDDEVEAEVATDDLPKLAKHDLCSLAALKPSKRLRSLNTRSVMVDFETRYFRVSAERTCQQ